MKFAWNTPLTDMADNIIHDEQGQPITLKTLVVQSLIALPKDDPDALAKFKRYQIASKVHNDVDLDITEAALIKEVTGSTLTPLPLGRVWELLEHPLP